MKVAEGSEVIVDVENQGDMDATVHWHGLRLENRYDGTHETQAPMAVGERFSARVAFPDPGVYWYHPHIREDYGQEMGLYGNVLVEPADPDYWPPVHREVVLTLDDILLEDGKVAPFSRSETTYAAMGRFGDVLLVSGEPDLALTARLGEVVRLYLTNTANTRVFKVKLPGARMKLVGGDSGHVEHEQFVDDVVLAPSERVVVDVLFDRAGELALEHHTPDRVYPLAAITVSERAGRAAAAEQFAVLRTNPDMAAERERVAPYLEAEPRQDAGVHRRDGHGRPARRRAGRLHVPDAPGGRQRGARPLPGVRHEAAAGGELVRCQAAERATSTAATTRGDARRAHGGTATADHEAAGGIEWEDDMVAVNRLTTPANMRWKIIDRETGCGERRDRLAVPGRRPGEDPAAERDGRRPSDAPPVPRPRRRALPRARPRRRRRAQPGVEGHGAGAHRRDRRHPARRHQRRSVDGALPHRRAPRERHDVQLQRHRLSEP